MPTYTSLKYVQNAGKELLTEQLRDNLVKFFDYGLVNTGHFVNVELAQSGAFADNSRMYISHVPSYTNGQVWQNTKKNWVYETDTDYYPAPLQVSGVYIDSAFYPIGTSGTHEFDIDYKNGRVIFTNAHTGVTVQVPHAYKHIQVERASHPFFRRIELNSYRGDSPDLSIVDSGVYNIPPENRVQLPAVFIQVLPERGFKPRELGGGCFVDTNVYFHIVTENERDLGHLIDIISCQYEKTIWLYDKNQAPFALDEFGFVSSGYLSYTHLVSESGYRWRECTFTDSYVEDIGLNTLPYYNGSVKLTSQVIMPEI